MTSNLINIVKMFSPESLSDFQQALSMRADNVMLEILAKAFNNAPDSGFVHLIPGWSDLCQLLSK